MPIAINGSGTVTGISVGGLPDGIVDTDMLAANAVSSAKLASGAGGKILQVVSTSTTNQFSTTSNSLTNCTPMTVNITPSATSSKVLVLVNMTVGGTADNRAGIALQRGSTDIFQGADSSSRQGVTTGTPTSEDNSVYNVAFQYLDSPSSTSELTYHIQVSAQTAGSETFYLNRSGNQSDDQRTKECASSITVMEVSG